MQYGKLPYVSFVTDSEETINKGDIISFSIIDNDEEIFEGELVKATKKNISIIREDSPCLEVYNVVEIKPESLKKI